MTPFETYFATHIEPSLKGAPKSAIAMAKASAADIWNAALDELFTPHVVINVSDIDIPLAIKSEIFQRTWKACVDRVQQRRVTP